MHTDLRDWLQIVENQGQLEKVSGAGWDLEMGGIVEVTYREGKDPKPCFLFDDIPGYPKGYRTLFGMLVPPGGSRRPWVCPKSRVTVWASRTVGTRDRKIFPIPPRFVTSGPVLENTLTGDHIDVLKFPVPRFHELDRSRYFGTAHAVIQRDPEEEWVNLGTYRVMVVDRNRLALHIAPGKHGNILSYEKYFAQGKVMPVAIATARPCPVAVVLPDGYAVGGFGIRCGRRHQGRSHRCDQGTTHRTSHPGECGDCD